MYLKDETVELVIDCYDAGKAYAKESDHAAYAEEILRMLVDRGYEFKEIVAEFGNHDTSFSEAIDNLTEEFIEEEEELDYDEDWD